LYFARRSERHGAPVLIWPVFSPTARSACSGRDGDSAAAVGLRVRRAGIVRRAANSQ
jgi:hypothetical protein